MKFFIFFLSFSAFASDVTIITDYYDGLGQTFREERAVSLDENCQETLMARKRFLQATNELREVALFDKQGRYKSGAGKDNFPEVHREVNEIFARGKSEKNPCEKKASVSGSLQ